MIHQRRPTKIVTKGDEQRAREHIGVAHSQMEILINSMKFQNLKQSVRRVTFGPDVFIECVKCFDLQECTITVLPSGKKEELQIENRNVWVNYGQWRNVNACGTEYHQLFDPFYKRRPIDYRGVVSENGEETQYSDADEALTGDAWEERIQDLVGRGIASTPWDSKSPHQSERKTEWGDVFDDMFGIDASKLQIDHEWSKTYDYLTVFAYHFGPHDWAYMRPENVRFSVMYKDEICHWDYGGLRTTIEGHVRNQFRMNTTWAYLGQWQLFEAPLMYDVWRDGDPHDMDDGDYKVGLVCANAVEVFVLDKEALVLRPFERLPLPSIGSMVSTDFTGVHWLGYGYRQDEDKHVFCWKVDADQSDTPSVAYGFTAYEADLRNGTYRVIKNTAVNEASTRWNMYLSTVWNHCSKTAEIIYHTEMDVDEIITCGDLPFNPSLTSSLGASQWDENPGESFPGNCTGVASFGDYFVLSSTCSIGSLPGRYGIGAVTNTWAFMDVPPPPPTYSDNLPSYADQNIFAGLKEIHKNYGTVYVGGAEGNQLSRGVIDISHKETIDCMTMDEVSFEFFSRHINYIFRTNAKYTSGNIIDHGIISYDASGYVRKISLTGLVFVPGEPSVFATYMEKAVESLAAGSCPRYPYYGSGGLGPGNSPPPTGVVPVPTYVGGDLNSVVDVYASHMHATFASVVGTSKYDGGSVYPVIDKEEFIDAHGTCPDYVDVPYCVPTYILNGQYQYGVHNKRYNGSIDRTLGGGEELKNSVSMHPHDHLWRAILLHAVAYDERDAPHEIKNRVLYDTKVPGERYPAMYNNQKYGSEYEPREMFVYGGDEGKQTIGKQQRAWFSVVDNEKIITPKE